MGELLEMTYYGNTFAQWLLAFSVILLTVLGGRVLSWFFKRWIAFLARRTAVQWDEVFVDQMEEPVIVVLTLLGVRLGLQILSLSEAADAFIANAFSFSVTLIVAWLISRLYDVIHTRYLVPLAETSENSLDDMLLPSIQKGIKAIIWGLAIIMGLSNAGYNIGAILAGLGIGGLAFALAAQDSVANIFGGITIFVQKPFTIGDEVIVNDARRKNINGYIRQIGLRSTMIEGKYGSTHLVPNRTFSESSIEKIQYTRTKYRIKRKLYLAHTTSAAEIAETVEMLKRIALAHAFVRKKSVYARFDDITDCAFVIAYQYEIKLWEESDASVFRNPKEKMFQVTTEMNLETLRQLEEKNITLALPALFRDGEGARAAHVIT